MDATDKTTHSSHEAADKIASSTNQAAEALGETGEQLKNAERRLIEDCHSYIPDKPMTSLGIAAAVDFLLSRLLERSLENVKHHEPERRK